MLGAVSSPLGAVEVQDFNDGFPPPEGAANLEKSCDVTGVSNKFPIGFDGFSFGFRLDFHGISWRFSLRLDGSHSPLASAPLPTILNMMRSTSVYG